MYSALEIDINDEGLTASVDIFRRGCTIYSIVSWQSFEHNLADHGDWAVPAPEGLPKLNDTSPLGIIKKGWTCQYQSAEIYQEAHGLFQPLSRDDPAAL